MPFDGTIETPAIRRLTLAFELRRGVGRWNFADSRRCAIPVARRLYGKTWPSLLGLTIRQHCRIFGVFAPLGYSRFYGCATSRVTPAMVADALERVGEGHAND